MFMRILSAASALLIVLLFLVPEFMSLSLRGFPDGHLTAYDRASKPLFLLLAIPGALVSAVLLYCAIRCPAPQLLSRYWRSMVVFLCFLALWIVADRILYQMLEHGQGG